MKIQLSVQTQQNMKSRIILSGLDEEGRYALLVFKPSVYLLATALMWLLGAEIQKDAGHMGAEGYDCDAVEEAHKAIY